MNTGQDRAKSIFLNAVEIASPAEREAYLAAECGDNQALREEVAGLLKHHAQAGAFLDAPAPNLVVTVDVPPEVTECAGTVIGPYRLLEQIGEGGFGIVFMAEQTQPVRRKVALKVLKPGMDTRQVVARFEAERQALAIMDHPNIAKVFDGGATASGRPYFVMELVKGVPITEFCDQNHLTPRQRLELFIPICQAVQHAHHKGIIHRDLKPSNVLVTVHDTTPVVKVIDFGVAKALGHELTDKTLFTGFAQMIGTPLYMSPEQAGQSGLDVDTRSDIYSLGVLLYELLTGTTPFGKERFKKAAYDEIRRIIREEEPPMPSTRLTESKESLASISAQRQTEPEMLKRLVRGELDWIVMKALEKDRNRRYETANGFASDVRRHLNDETVQACPPSAAYRLRKFVRRNKRALAAAAAFAGLLFCATAVSLCLAAWALRAESATHEALEQVTDEQQKTRMALENETAARKDALERLRESYFVQAQANRWSGRPGRRFNSLPALSKAAAISAEGGPSLLELRNEAIASLALADVSSEPVWQATLPNVGALAMDPAFEHYATWSREEGKLYVRRRSDHAEVARLPALKDSIWPVVFSPDGRLLAFGNRGDISDNPAEGKRHRLDVWDWKQRTLVLTAADAPVSASGALFSPDSSRLVVTWEGGKVMGHGLRDGKPPASLPVSGSVVAFHPDGTRLAVASGNTLTVCDAVTGRAVSKPIVTPGTVFAANWSPDGELLAIGCANTRAYLYDARTGAMRTTLAGHQVEVNRVYFSPDGSVLASTDYNAVTRLWSAPGGRPLVAANGAARGFSRDGTQLSYVNGSRAGIWQAAYGRECRELWGHTCFKGPGGVQRALDGSFVASSGDDATRLWDLAAGKQIGMLPVSGNSLRFGPRGTHWFTGGESGFSRWPVQPAEAGGRMRIGPPEKLYEGIASAQNGIDLSADGQWLVVTDRLKGQVFVRSTANPTQQKTFTGFVELGSAAISADGRWLAAGGWPHPWIHVFDLAAERCVHKVPLISSATFAFSPDSKWLAVGNSEGGRLLEAGSWTRHREIPPRKGSRFVAVFAFSPDGRTLAAAREGHVIQLLDVDTLTEFAALESPVPTPHSALCFSPDGSRLAAVGLRVVRIWDLRAIRAGLVQIGLDWNAPPYPEATPHRAAPLSVEVAAASRAESSEAAALRRGMDLNNQAWKLLAGPPEQRDAVKGLALIQEAVKLRPHDVVLLNTLGVAQYRNARCRDALTTFEKSLAAGKGQWDGFDLYFMAMSHAKLGDKVKARECMTRALRWVELQKNLTPEHTAELKQFHAEAEAVLSANEAGKGMALPVH